MFTFKSYAKVNLNLYIIGRNTEGYHLLQSVFYPIKSLYDTIIIECISNDGASVFVDEVSLQTAPYIEPFKEGLINKTLELMRSYFNFECSFKITLHKNIPIGAGLGGGSSNAATIICALNNIFELRLSNTKKVEIAKKIGADVPFFLHNKPSIVEGIGEKITPIHNPKDYFILLVTPNFSVETVGVYKEYRNWTIENKAVFSKELDHTTLSRDSKIAINNLQPMVEYKNPKITALLNSFKECDGCLSSAISGSGSSCFGIFENEKSLAKALKSLKLAYPHYNFFSCVNA